MVSTGRPERRVILHGGMPKTGSASIQRVLCSAPGRALLSAAQVQLLTTPTAEPGGNYSRYLASLLGAPRWLSPAERAANLESMTVRIRDAVTSLPTGHSLLISAESAGEIAARDGAALRRIRDYLGEFFTDVAFVAYVREPLSYVCSRFQQGVKAGHPAGRALRGAIGGCDLAALIRNANEVFGHEKVLIRPFDPALMTSPDAVVDFAVAVLGAGQADAGALAGQADRLNRGLPMELLEPLLQLYQGRGITARSISPGFVHALGRVDWAGTRFSPAFFSAEDRLALLDATDKVRVEVVELLGYDPFPSYRPFLGSPWDADGVDPQTHARNRNLALGLTEARRKGRGVDPSPQAAGAGRDRVGEWPTGDGATRDSVLHALGELYDAFAA